MKICIHETFPGKRIGNMQNRLLTGFFLRSSFVRRFFVLATTNFPTVNEIKAFLKWNVGVYATLVIRWRLFL